MFFSIAISIVDLRWYRGGRVDKDRAKGRCSRVTARWCSKLRCLLVSFACCEQRGDVLILVNDVPRRDDRTRNVASGGDLLEQL